MFKNPWNICKVVKESVTDHCLVFSKKNMFSGGLGAAAPSEILGVFEKINSCYEKCI